MPTFRASMIFTATTANLGRQAGWSESWYKVGTAEAIMMALQTLCGTRVNMAPSAVQIVGQRLQQLGGRSQTDNTLYTGRNRLNQDIPQMAAQCSVATLGFTQKKGFSLRGLPDDVVSGGDYRAAAGVGPAIAAFFSQLATDAWQWQARDTSLPATQIVSIAPDGTFVLQAPMVFAVGDFVNMVRVRNVSGHSVKGDFYVSARTDAQHGVLFNWTGGQVNLKGKMRVRTYTYPIVGAGTGKVIQVMTRKVGRPSNQYRGRATNRR